MFFFILKMVHKEKKTQKVNPRKLYVKQWILAQLSWLNQCWGTNFWALISLAYSQNTHIGFSQIFPTLLLNLGSHKYSLYKPHKLSWAISHILPTYYSTWVFTKISIILIQKLGHKIILSPQKTPKNIYLMGKSKKPNKTPFKACCYTAPLNPVMTRHSKSPLRYDTSKTRYDMTPLKPVMTRHFKSPLWYSTSKSPLRYNISKTHYDTAL